MSPQPLRVYEEKARKRGDRRNHVEIGPEVIDRIDSEIVVRVAKFLAIWAHIDHQRNVATSLFLSTDYPEVAVLLGEIVSRPARVEALDALARYSLGGAKSEDYGLFQSALRAAGAIDRRRNQFAHNLWAISTAAPGHLVLVDPKDALKAGAEHDALFAKIRNATADGSGPRMSRTMFGGVNRESPVFNARDMDREIRDARKARTVMDEIVLWRSGGPLAQKARESLASRFQIAP